VKSTQPNATYSKDVAPTLTQVAYQWLGCIKVEARCSHNVLCVGNQLTQLEVHGDQHVRVLHTYSYTHNRTVLDTSAQPTGQ
jgi:hypothetical protein